MKIIKGNFFTLSNNLRVAFLFVVTVTENRPKCPKCGSTQIQLINRKFTILTGFATNKVDRVCVNCKHRW